MAGVDNHNLGLRFKMFFLFTGLFIFIASRPWIAMQNYNRAQTYLSCRFYDKAESQFKKALFLMPRFTRCYESLGYMYENLSRYEDAVSVYKTSLSYEPRNSTAYFRIGFYYAYVKKDYLKALQWFYRAYYFNPGDRLVINWIGVCYQKLGLADKAQEYYSKIE